MLFATNPLADRRALAVAVWVRAVACGAVLGAAGAAVVVTPMLLSGTDPRGVLIVFALATGVGNAFGVIVGTLVGAALALLVRFGQRRLGTRVVATLMPLTALLVTQPLVYALFRALPTAPLVAVLLLDALFTVLGARWIARQYRLLAAFSVPVH